MTFIAFVAFVLATWGIQVPTDAWAEAVNPSMRFMETADLTHGGCAEIVMVGWPDGRREVAEIRVRWPDRECPPAYLVRVGGARGVRPRLVLARLRQQQRGMR